MLVTTVLSEREDFLPLLISGLRQDDATEELRARLLDNAISEGLDVLREHSLFKVGFFKLESASAMSALVLQRHPLAPGGVRNGILACHWHPGAIFVWYGV